ncbi:dna repair protein [Diplodia corticola]|uniref:Dna repair protein n=1 Tax=Diplodia corticola TaxID=236234 RepID=A0A1J9SDT5_9PEZI|nr:dna repair protein [Diplodia corticola]OJD37996.1 dna repair protein [Diplodia corticola]
MAPLPAKRHRAPTDLDSDDYESPDEGSGNRRDSRKRQRLSGASNTPEDDNVDGALQDTQRGVEMLLDGNGDTSFLDESMIDAETGEVDVDFLLGNEEDRLAGLKRIIEKRFKHRTDNMPAENAIIEEVKCINFMCHAHLTVPLGPLINFVIGHNGSGKSAVMTALTLCLGGKATSTNRGQSLKSFIKEGEDSAMLAVKIKNHGSSAFKPEIYGKSIIVERHFNKNGASGFKIKNVKEKVVSTKKSDLEDIIDAFQLQMDNPMNVLSQDMARQFLNHSTPLDKYKFFIEGTQLAALNRDYRILEEYLNEIEAKHAIKKQDVEVLAKKREEAKERWRAAGKQSQMRQKASLVQRQYAWKQVEVEEDKMVGADTHMAEAEAEISQKTVEVEEASNKYDQCVRTLQEAEQKVDEYDEEKRPIQERLDDAKKVFNEGKEELQELQAQHRQIKSSLQGNNAIIRKIEEDIQEERRRQEDANGGDHGRRRQEIDEAKAIAQERKAVVEELFNAIPSLEHARDEARTHLEAFRPTLQQKQNDVIQQERHIGEIRRNRGSWNAGFDQGLHALLGAIDNENRFRNKPVGPMGRHIRLLKPEWSGILEKSAGMQLNAFVVTSKHDEGVLKELMRRVNYPRDPSNTTPIVIGNPTPLDTSGKEPDPHLLTWMRALKFDNDLVRNQMIINNLIENTVLIEDFDEAYNFALGSGTGEHHPRPRNVKQVYTMAKNKRGGVRFGWSLSGGGTQAPIQTSNNRLPRMQTEVESRVNVATEELRRYKLDLQQAENEFRERQLALKRAEQALIRHDRDFQNARYAAQAAEEDWERMSDALEQERPQVGRLQELERQLEEATDDKETNLNMIKDATEAREKINEQQRERRSQQMRIEEELSELNAKLSKAQIRVNRVQTHREAALHDKNQAYEAMELAHERLKSYQQQREELQHDIAAMVEQAAQVGERPHIAHGETVDSLGLKYQKLQEEIDRQNQRQVLGGSEEELQTQYLEAVAAHKTAEKDIHDMEHAQIVLKGSLDGRKARLVIFKRAIADRSRITFTYLLAARKFRGDLRIDHKAKELDLAVEPDIMKAGAEGRQTRTLSGGEKSFSTVCLLLSLWDAMGAPTRCLDEFDVFMDSVNREISMKMIIDACRCSAMRQFLFITPQAMGNVSLGQDVKIIKMSDPERGQTTLSF